MVKKLLKKNIVQEILNIIFLVCDNLCILELSGKLIL